ncbi:MAG: hypothetical protein LBL34_02005 [Clostridiales bacterium]|nr:hypothetical protein [Clostridiales bacterium]
MAGNRTGAADKSNEFMEREYITFAPFFARKIVVRRIAEWIWTASAAQGEKYWEIFA